MNVHDVIAALLGAVASLGLQGVAAGFIAIRQYTRQEFSGTIYGILPPSGGKGERVEKMRIRQRGQRIQVRIRRISPSREAGRHWKMTGYTHGNLIVGTFSTIDPRVDPSSYGVMVLHRDPEIKECGVWRGYYIRPDLYGIKAVTTADVARYPIVWQQISPAIHNYGCEAPPASLPSRQDPGLDATGADGT